MLVAHGEGELHRRALEGPDLVALSPRNEVDLSAAWKLSRVIRQWQPQIVHAHDPHAVAMAALSLSFAAPEPRPRIIAARRVDFHLQRHSFSRWKYRQVDLFVAASEAIRDILISDGIPSRRTVVVHDGIDVAKVGRLPTVDVRTELWLPHGVPVLAHVGALVDHKGQRYLIEAMPQVIREVPDVHLVIFGEGELRPALERQIRELHLEKQVRLAGFREDVLQLVKSADLFVMSSVTEGLGSTVLDAMAMGHAVVGTRAGGMSEAVVHGETGLLAPVGDAASLAKAIVRLLKNPELKAQMGEAGIARVSARFSVARMLQGTLDAYERATRLKPRGGNEDSLAGDSLRSPLDPGSRRS